MYIHPTVHFFIPILLILIGGLSFVLVCLILFSAYVCSAVHLVYVEGLGRLVTIYGSPGQLGLNLDHIGASFSMVLDPFAHLSRSTSTALHCTLSLSLHSSIFHTLSNCNAGKTMSHKLRNVAKLYYARLYAETSYRSTRKMFEVTYCM